MPQAHNTTVRLHCGRRRGINACGSVVGRVGAQPRGRFQGWTFTTRGTSHATQTFRCVAKPVRVLRAHVLRLCGSITDSSHRPIRGQQHHRWLEPGQHSRSTMWRDRLGQPGGYSIVRQQRESGRLQCHPHSRGVGLPLHELGDRFGLDGAREAGGGLRHQPEHVRHPEHPLGWRLAGGAPAVLLPGGQQPEADGVLDADRQHVQDLRPAPAVRGHERSACGLQHPDSRAHRGAAVVQPDFRERGARHRRQQRVANPGRADVQHQCLAWPQLLHRCPPIPSPAG